MRAFSMAVDQIVGVAGWVLPQTRVDVLLTMSDIQGTKEPATKVIMQNVRTLAAGQSIQQDKEGKPQAVGVVTFLLTPEQAETLALASGQGRIQLALRNTLDTALIMSGIHGSGFDLIGGLEANRAALEQLEAEFGVRPRWLLRRFCWSSD